MTGDLDNMGGLGARFHFLCIVGAILLVPLSSSGSVLPMRGLPSFDVPSQTTENPQKFSLRQNFPNPFNPSTRIVYSVPRRQFVLMKVYNLLGTELETLVNGEQSAGVHSVFFDGSRLPGGVYFYRMESKGVSLTKRMVLIK